MSNTHDIFPFVHFFGREPTFFQCTFAYLLFIESHRLSLTFLMATRKVAHCLLDDLKACGIEEQWRTNTHVECDDREIFTSLSQVRKETERKTFATRLTRENPFRQSIDVPVNTCAMGGD